MTSPSVAALIVLGYMFIGYLVVSVDWWLQPENRILDIPPREHISISWMWPAMIVIRMFQFIKYVVFKRGMSDE